MILKPWTKILITVVTITIASLILASISSAQDAQEPLNGSTIGSLNNTSLKDILKNLWVLVAGILVLMMQLGFALLAAGFNAAKNTVNTLFSHIASTCLGILVYFAFGYAVMYRPETSSEFANVLEIPGFLGISQPYIFLNTPVPREGAEHLFVYIDFFFQATLAATAANICFGAVAGRIKPWAYLLLTVIITGVVYPVSGYWVWGGGFLGRLGFDDFAGSVVVYTVGGSAALVVAIILKPRRGRFSDREKLSEAEEKQLLPHNLPLAAIGAFILWIGWYGFNAGNALGITGDIISLEIVGKIALNTTIAACSSALTVIVHRWFRSSRQIDLSTVLNGILGGLVGITASCDVVSPPQSLIVGTVAGLIFIMGINRLYEIKIDDTVGAIPTYCFCGIWGGLAAGLLTTDINITIQLTSTLVMFSWSFSVVWLLFNSLNSIVGIRVKLVEEKFGLDWSEHAEYAYLSLEDED